MLPMKLLNGLLQGTPIWVFALFGYLVWVGIKGLTVSERKVSRVWITPAIFIAWGVIGLLMRPGAIAGNLLHWFIAALAGSGLGLLLRVPLQIDASRNLVVQSGSVVPLIRNVGIFGAHYALNVLAAMTPELSAQYMTWDIYVSGASAGYFAGWAIRFVQLYVASAAGASSTSLPSRTGMRSPGS
jgi:hypothetical protein